MSKSNGNDRWLDRRVKVVFLDGNLNSGEPRVFRGTVVGEDEHKIMLETEQGPVDIYHSVIVKITPEEIGV